MFLPRNRKFTGLICQIQFPNEVAHSRASPLLFAHALRQQGGSKGRDEDGEVDLPRNRIHKVLGSFCSKRNWVLTLRGRDPPSCNAKNNTHDAIAGNCNILPTKANYEVKRRPQSATWCSNIMPGTIDDGSAATNDRSKTM